jgi:ribosomal protein S18 acetylase RimI-like enzyme
MVTERRAPRQSLRRLGRLTRVARRCDIVAAARLESLDVKLSGTLKAVDYSEQRAPELVRMWRSSFERGVGVVDPHPLEAQLAFLQREVVPQHKLLLVLDGAEGPVAAFIAFSKEKVAQLYVHIEYQGRGIGTALLDVAKSESSGRLQLFTFARNTLARRFYEKNGFREIGQGFESEWQLADVEYAWLR